MRLRAAEGGGTTPSRGLVAVLTSLFFLTILHGVNLALMDRYVPDPYMDEIFHAPQAEKFCRADSWLNVPWDPKITTPAGIYVAAAGLYELFKVIGSAGGDGFFRCSASAVGHLRALNALLNVVWVFAAACTHLVKAVRTWEKACRERRHGRGNEHDAKTDERNHTAWRDRDNCLRNVYTHYLTELVRVAACDLPFHAFAGAGFVFFVRWNNYALTLGHQEYHQPTPHLAMVLYLGVLVPLLGFFPWAAFVRAANESELLVSGSARTDDKAKGVAVFFRTFVRETETLWAADTAAIALKLFVLFSLASTIPIAHPFLLSDNRHLTFYLWRRVFSVAALRVVICPIVATAGCLAYLGAGRSPASGYRGTTSDVKRKMKEHGTEKETHPSGVNQKHSAGAADVTRDLILKVYWNEFRIFLGCTLLALATLPLFELRYFAVPLLALTLARPLQSKMEEAIGIGITLLLSLAVWGLFYGKTFENEKMWGPGKQRIML
eukprot:g756.t1